MTQPVTLQLPESIYERVRRAAEATQRPVEDVLIKTIEAVMPPSVDDFRFHIAKSLSPWKASVTANS